MSPYRIKGTCADPLWKHITTCEIGISPGNPAHEGDKLASILDWAGERFQSSILTLSDTMYRHNFMSLGHNEEESYKLGQALGENWLQNNAAILEAHKEKIRIYRWDQWKDHQDFPRIYDDLMAYIATSQPLRQALDADIQAFIARKIRQDQGLDMAKARMHSFNLITEEIACYILIGRHFQLARAYPSRDMQSFAFMRLPQTPAHLKGFENIKHVELTLNRRGQGIAQAA